MSAPRPTGPFIALAMSLFVVGLLLFTTLIRKSRENESVVIPSPTPAPVVTLTPTPAPDPPAASIAGENLMDDATVSRLIADLGSYAAVYERADQGQRAELVEYLGRSGALRDHLEELLAVETDSEFRARIITRSSPRGMESGGEESDSDFLRVLAIAPPTPMGRNEYLARMYLAGLVDEEASIEWAERGFTEFGQDPAYVLHASSALLRGNETLGGDAVEPARLEAAAAAIRDILRSDAFGELEPGDRISAYYGIYWTEEQDALGGFYQEMLGRETDPNAQTALLGLLGMLAEPAD